MNILNDNQKVNDSITNFKINAQIDTRLSHFAKNCFVPAEIDT